MVKKEAKSKSFSKFSNKVSIKVPHGTTPKKKIKVLILYFKMAKYKDRNTIDEHLHSFRRYADGVEFHYFNAANGVPRYLTYPRYDGVILHYTFLAVRWSKELYDNWSKTIKRLKALKGYKVGIPQDEYAETDVLCNLFREYDVKTVFTCFFEEDYQKVYPPEKVPLEHLITVFPGYIDEDEARRLQAFCDGREERSIDLGYRARKLPYWLGRHGQLKHEIGQLFLEKTKDSGLKVDISTSNKDVFFGNDWYKFLCRCRAVLGCEGGASLLDPTGNIRINVEDYVENHPDASFEEVEQACFRGKDYNIRLFALSPRHFECVITKTCQVLVEGEYGGIFIPGVHFIELKKDYSNLDAVIEQLKDATYCKKIADNAFRDVFKSGKYSYRAFVNQVIEHIAEKTGEKNQSANDRILFHLIGRYLSIRESLDPVLVKVFFAWRVIKIYKLGLIRKTWNRVRGKRG